MEQPDYTYIFGDISNQLNDVQIIDHRRNRQQTFQVSVDDRPEALCPMPAIIADLIDLAVAVHVADRHSTSQKDTTCNIQVCLPVRSPEILGRKSIIECLQDTMWWFTNDHWQFEFTRRTANGRRAELQKRMSLNAELAQPKEVALWSGGLDSLAGLYNRLLTEPHTYFTLFGTGSSSVTHATQRETAENIASLFPARTRLVQIPIRLDQTQDMVKNRHQRSRGFVFQLLGAACANLAGQNVLHIYENGVGAINLPFRASEVGLDHSRSVHPLSLIKMGDFVTQVIGHRFEFRNPFLFWTKAQMCKVLAQKNESELVAYTITCDRPPRHEQYKQCGCCSSCLLRRQALAAQGIPDRTHYAVSYGSQDRVFDKSHLKAMLLQVKTLNAILDKPDAWRMLSKKYHVLPDIVDQLTTWIQATQEGINRERIEESLINLYCTYIHEWDAIQNIVECWFLKTENLHATSSIDSARSLPLWT